LSLGIRHASARRFRPGKRPFDTAARAKLPSEKLEQVCKTAYTDTILLHTPVVKIFDPFGQRTVIPQRRSNGPRRPRCSGQPPLAPFLEPLAYAEPHSAISAATQKECLKQNPQTRSSSSSSTPANRRPKQGRELQFSSSKARNCFRRRRHCHEVVAKTMSKKAFEQWKARIALQHSASCSLIANETPVAGAGHET
jgi:hypothetical protein